MNTKTNDVSRISRELSELKITMCTELGSTREQIATLSAERAEILLSPITKADYLALVLADCDRKSIATRERFGMFVRRAGTAPNSSHEAPRKWPALVKTALAAPNSSAPEWVSLLEYGDRPIPSDALYFWCGDSIKAAIKKSFATIDDWTPEGHPLAEALARIAAIDGEVSLLQARESTLLADARDLGVSIEPSAAAPSPPAADATAPRPQALGAYDARAEILTRRDVSGNVL